jgi:3-oxoacyl-ACP reductase-like protein
METISIYDRDLNKLLVDNKPIISAYKDFLYYVSDESLGEWWNDNEEHAPIFSRIIKSISDDEFNEVYNSLFSLWIDEIVTTEIGREYIKEEIYAYNFEILNN